jgi:hypothetical protein
MQVGAGASEFTITYRQTTAGITTLEVKRPDLESFSPLNVIMRRIKPVNELPSLFTYL